MKKTNENGTATAIETTSPFAFAPEAETMTNSRKLDLTPVLQAMSIDRATDAIKMAAATPEMHTLSNKMMDDGEVSDLLEFLTVTGAMQFVETDALKLENADEDQLKRMLESRRSDRSKSKKKGLRSNISVCRTYIASMYAELVIRQVMGKPYNGPAATSEIDFEAIKGDMDAVNKKIKSLQSKKCRLKKTAQFCEADKKELETVEAEIGRLSGLRPTQVSAKSAVKSLQVDELRDILKNIDTSELPETEQAKLAELMKNLG